MAIDWRAARGTAAVLMWDPNHIPVPAALTNLAAAFESLTRQVAAARDHADRTRASYRDDPGPECCASTATVVADVLTDAIDAAAIPEGGAGE